jgi:hypothetical protein
MNPPSPRPNDLVRTLAFCLRDCLYQCGDDDLDVEAHLLWDEYGHEEGVTRVRGDGYAVDLAERMGECLAQIAASTDCQVVREIAVAGADAFAQAAPSLIDLDADELFEHEAAVLEGLYDAPAYDPWDGYEGGFRLIA